MTTTTPLIEKPFTLADLQQSAETVYSMMPATPQYHWPLLSNRLGAEVWIKHENHTPVGAFKIRGGLTYFHWLSQAYPEVRGVVTATRGNHGQSIGLAAAKYGIQATIIVPEGNSLEKNAAMRALGVNLIEYGHDVTASIEYAKRLAETENLHLVPSVHQELVRGVATYALEFLTACPDLDTLYVAVGMGSGICGAIAARDALGSRTKIVGVVSSHAAAYALSFNQKKLVTTDTANTLADGVACRQPNEQALAMIIEGADRVIAVDDNWVLKAMKAYYVDTHNIAEGAGAIPLAGLMSEQAQMQGKKVGVVLSGGNVDYTVYQQALGVDI